MKFLQQVAQYLYNKNQGDLSQIRVVFPNRRAGLFFQKYLSQLSDIPLFSPQIFTISEMVSEISGLVSDDKNRLVIELYSHYKVITRSTESLDDFFYWGEMMLADFDDIDKYTVDAKQLFTNIESLKEIDYGFDFLSDEQRRYLSVFWENVNKSQASESTLLFKGLWSKLYDIYSSFRSGLLQKKLAYEGLMYRHMLAELEKMPDTQNWQNCVFVGFNALNACEKKLFSYMKNNSDALFFWDYDNYYVDAGTHEAAIFMHHNLRDYPMPADFDFSSDNFSTLSEIELVSIPGFSGQASYASQWVEKNKDHISSEFDNTAIVMCDETLLLSMINSMPDSVTDFNITMGFPVKKSPAYSLLRGLIDIERNSRKNKKNETIFYYRNVMGLLSNPILRNILGDFFDTLFEKIKTENRIYIGVADFDNHDLLIRIFTLPETPEQCRDYLQGVIQQIFTNISDENKLLKESLYQLHKVINRLHDSLFSSLADLNIELSKNLYYKLLLRQLDRLSIPFEGEPLSGMQLMGFLETRCLDFDNLILLSFNDSKLPGTPFQHSFIPYSLRKGFALPVIEQRNAMYAYYFYRLIQRAKNVSLVYDSRTEGLSRGEVSRYAVQLKYEAKHLKLVPKQAVFNFDPDTSESISIKKDNQVMEMLEKYMLEKRISPSALNTYMHCPLQFYFKYIEGLKELDDLQEDIDNLLFGRIAHKTLEFLYTPFEGNELTSKMIEELITNKQNIDKALQRAMEEEYFKKGNFSLNGRNILVYEIIKKYIFRILQYDKSIAPFTIISLEKTYETKTQIEVNNKIYTITYGGIVDRLDKLNGRIRVIDYKTGKADNKVADIDKMFVGSKRNKAAFQTMLYSACVADNYKTLDPILPAVYGAQAVFSPDFSPFFIFGKNATLIYEANAQQFEKKLQELFTHILDKNEDFIQVSDAGECKYCPYKTICQRI